MKIPERWTFDSPEVASNFDTHVRETLPWYEMVTGAVSHICRHYIPKGGTVYDLGASTGNIGRAIEATLTEREAKLISVDCSADMLDQYEGPQPENVLISDICSVDYQPFDVAILFLTAMFIPTERRLEVIGRLTDQMRLGGCIIIVDKAEAGTGYLSTVMWRLTLAGKVSSGVSADQIVAKELSLGGVQRPLSDKSLPKNAVEFFRFGDFAGWVIE
jgi:tRNA (cmo5U34)-methyltransferase